VGCMKRPMRCVVLATAVCAAAEEPADLNGLRARAEARSRADLARRKDVAQDAIRVVQVVERLWPDERLGCSGRRMVLDPVPVPGFRLLLAHGERHYVYHADRGGRFVPCDLSAKPIDRIR
jgi:hypothetical protein